ncbi:hypothetical protein THASP1DRAFT_30828 [Thamnocephalis sphaerospora]|uniref:Glutaredoxin domain-containing protein n=1 Tax=Thamnocephalis sphaerospora TaxID=78915 RepID=A0A4V1IWF3_9FUNG|nr:hypothetical protein THASP1DRAFT_30828 [Thamnocephalis sphaerospora]|eukprot:RKP07359.1 hypothetical protein THASP1DRAFT_30828 [Thamnocephalis sphaerospora]
MHFAYQLPLCLVPFIGLIIALHQLTRNEMESLPHVGGNMSLGHPIQLKQGMYTGDNITVHTQLYRQQSMIPEDVAGAGAGAAAEVKHLIRQHPVLVFGTTHCPHTDRIKEILDRYLNMVPPYHVINVDQRSNTKEIEAYLAKSTGQATVARAVIRGKSIGADALLTLDRNGGLRRLLRNAGVIY